MNKPGTSQARKDPKIFGRKRSASIPASSPEALLLFPVLAPEKSLSSNSPTSHETSILRSVAPNHDARANNMGLLTNPDATASYRTDYHIHFHEDDIPEDFPTSPETLPRKAVDSNVLNDHSFQFASRHDRSLSFRNTQPQTEEENGFRRRGATMPTDSFHQFRERRRQRFLAGTRERSLSPNFSPLDHQEDDTYRLRNFTITSKGNVINRGDLLKHRSRSNLSVASTTSLNCQSCASTGTSGSSSWASPYKILMLGDVGVGKSTLVTQFMSSEYSNSSQDEVLEKPVSVLLDGEEYELIFIDHPIRADIMDPDDEVASSADAYVVVYSVADRDTFEKAIDILFCLRERGYTATQAVILVANKTDMVRSRDVTREEGRTVAISYECKYSETSALINHKVDDLLVGIVSQIRLKTQQLSDMGHMSPTTRVKKHKSKGYLHCPSGHRARGLFNKLFGKGNYKSKSCDNLQVL
ncbi:GTP-binding protein GEM-like [Limulus polyphemus]|uniref:GTP-binding protein GEM-like n=1 Tax=Limulus polyphemus TaxID=6850 RepID=A0ABM1B9L3_LIMPO|nr:GTP-binding protein GEM-like [Limulus polyphemus]